MGSLTKAEKIELAEAQVKQAEIMVKSSREKLNEWISVLELRQEYLEAVSKVTDMKLKGSETKIEGSSESPKGGKS